MKILLPTDFSENASLASEFAIDIAKRTQGSITALHAYDLPYSEHSMTTSLLEEMKKTAEQHMHNFATESLQTSGVDHQTKILMGNPIRLIKNLSKEGGYDLVVMGTRGATGIEEFLIGSNAASVIQGLDIPVLVIPPQSKPNGFEKIVLASDLDLSKKERPLQRLRNFAKIFGSTIEILHMQTSGGSDAGSRELLDQILHDVPHNYSLMKDEGDRDDNILNHCELKGASLVSAITRKYGFFEGLFRQSLTNKLAYHTSIPMLALHESK